MVFLLKVYKVYYSIHFFPDNNAKLIGEYDSNQRKSNSKVFALDLSRIIETTNLSIATRGIETLEKEIRFDSEALVRIHDKFAHGVERST